MEHINSIKRTYGDWRDDMRSTDACPYRVGSNLCKAGNWGHVGPHIWQRRDTRPTWVKRAMGATADPLAPKVYHG